MSEVYVHLCDGVIEVRRQPDGYQLTKEGITLLSPTEDFSSFGMQHFHSKFQRVTQISEGDICLDVGACIGDTAIPMAILAGSKGHVIAVEPEPSNLYYLKHNLAEYNATIIPKAVGEQKGTATLHCHSSMSGHSLIPHETRSNSVTVEVDTLDSVLDDVRVDWAKIDVQGSEAEVLEGAPHFLGYIKKLVVETHDRNSKDATYPRVVEVLRRHDFKQIAYTPKTGLIHCVR